MGMHKRLSEGLLSAGVAGNLCNRQRVSGRLWAWGRGWETYKASRGAADHHLELRGRSGAKVHSQHSSRRVKRKAANTLPSLPDKLMFPKGRTMETGCLVDKHFLGGTGGHLVTGPEDLGYSHVSLKSYFCLLHPELGRDNFGDLDSEGKDGAGRSPGG